MEVLNEGKPKHVQAYVTFPLKSRYIFKLFPCIWDATNHDIYLAIETFNANLYLIFFQSNQKELPPKKILRNLLFIAVWVSFPHLKYLIV